MNLDHALSLITFANGVLLYVVLVTTLRRRLRRTPLQISHRGKSQTRVKAAVYSLSPQSRAATRVQP